MKSSNRSSTCERIINWIGLSKMLLFALILFFMIGGSVVRSTSSAEGSYSVPFSMNFCKQIDEKSHGLRNVIIVDDVYYGIVGESLFKFDQNTDTEPALYCTVPVNDYWDESFWKKSQADLSAEQLELLTNRIDRLAVGEGVIMGYNLLSGRVCEIVNNTVNWLPVKIDTSIFYRGNGIISYFNPLYSFVLNHTLYMFGENNNQVEPKSSAMALISFDLTTGQHQSFQINDATNCCPYKDNQILLLCPVSNKKMKLCLLQTDTGEVSDMNIEIPFPDNSKNGKESIGGLAYDKDRDVIFFFVEGKVWKSKEHSELYSVELFDEYSSDYSFPAWTTSKGEYAIFMYGLLYIVDIAE